MSELIKAEKFNQIQREAKAVSMSDLVPASYKGNISNCIIAIDLANRMGIAPLMVMQNLDVIKGKPSWNSTFIIGAINTSGRFKGGLKFKMEGAGDSLSCYAYATEAETGETLEGTKITMKMANAEGWTTKAGSKWQTMPEQMIRYRAASFFGRLYCPEILNGLYTREEIEDIQEPQKPLAEEELLTELDGLIAKCPQDVKDKMTIKLMKEKNVYGGITQETALNTINQLTMDL